MSDNTLDEYELNQNTEGEKLHEVIKIDGLYQNWFLDYASYVILDRAVPHIYDGLKPVQRRILHSLKEMDDGRYNKAANVIGNTMKYHPHGDVSIGDAMVQIGQKNLLIDCQGNWGDPVTGDSAAAPRYIEARLTKFALEVAFNAQTTTWQSSYDGRNREPVTLPMKFPLLLAQGAEGIAVGLATKIMPHNFIELIDGCIDILKGKKTNILPDFYTGGAADFSNYNEGQRGGRIRVRAKINEKDKKTLTITEVPFSTTTGSLIDSIINANEKGKIKIRKIEDNTAKNVEIVVHLAPGISPDVTIDALYAFTDCEVSISPNTCIIRDDRPYFLSVNVILEESAFHTRNLLQLELEIRLNELNEKWHFSSLEKIFIENRMYRNIEVAESEDEAVAIIDKLLKPFKKLFKREITSDDILKLMEIRIKRITKYDAFKADELLKNIDEETKEVNHNLLTITDYSIAYFKKLKEKYGKGRERKTEIRAFDKVEATQVALANVKLYVNRADGFVGSGLKKDEFVVDCSDIDEVIAFRGDGKFMVTKVADKTFVGKDIEHVAVFRKNDERTVYNMIYRDGDTGISYMKRFAVTGVTRDKEYDLTKGSKGSKTLYFTANPNGEAETIAIHLKPHSKLKKLLLEIPFADLAIKGRSSLGNMVTKYPIKKIELKSKGFSTLQGRKIWFDETLKRLNVDSRGELLGTFDGDDKLFILYPNGSFELKSFELNNHFDEPMLYLQKFDPDKVISAVHLDGKSKLYYVKRFVVESNIIGKRISFINESPGSKLIVASLSARPLIHFQVTKGKAKEKEDLGLELADFIDVKGIKAIGNRLTSYDVKKVELIKREEEIEEPIETDKKIIANETVRKNIPLEIENPDDIELGNDGQTKMF